MTYSSRTMAERLISVRTNPSQMQRVQLEALEAVMDGSLDIVDATNPFMFLLESQAVTGAATMGRVEAVTRKLYPSLAATELDLYRHMSDVDYLGRFSLPDRATIVLALRWSEVLNNVVQVPDSDVKKLVIPRNTKFEVDGIDFGMQYPIEIRLMPHGGFNVVYVNDLPSPLWELKTNLVPWTRTALTIDGVRDYWMMIPIEVRQFTLTHITQPLNSSSGFNKSIDLADNYYYCRVYGLNGDGLTWTEYLTTHSDQVYDAKKPTAKLTVADKKLNVYLPQIYFSSGLLGAQIRIDVYTTKGPLNLNLAEYQPSVFKLSYEDFDTKLQTSRYTAPLPNISGTQYSTDSKTSGGSLPIPFETLREQVIMNSTYVKTPITGAQLETSQQINGFNILKSKDNITSRLYAASKALPTPSSGSLNAGAGTMMAMLETNLTDLATRSTVVDNGSSVTITPETLFEVRNNVLNVMSEADYQTIKGQLTAKNWDDLLVNIERPNRQVVYTPFHYVLDTVGNQFDMRAYHLASPKVTNRNFIAENATTLLSCGTGDVSLFRTATGYRLVVLASTSAAYQALSANQLHLQLAYKAVGEDDYAYMTGEIIGKSGNENVWQFDIDTTYYLNELNQIQFSGFSMFDGEIIKTLSELDQQMYLVWSVSGYTANDMEASDIDKLVYKKQVPADSIAVTQESLELSFGTALNWLWRRSRTVKDSITYETYPADVPKYYTSREYALDSDGTRKLQLNAVSNEYEFIVTHEVGDPVLDANGNQTYLHRKGEPVKVNGELVVAGPRAVVRHVDLMLVDGRFYFATEQNDVAYRTELADAVVGYLSDIADINDRLLENTEMYYVPVTTLGDITVLIGAGVETTISSTQSFVVHLYLNQTNYNNGPLREALNRKVNQLIHQTLKESTFSVDGLASVISDALSSDVMAVDVDPIGANKNLSVFTAVDEITRCSVKRKLVVLPEGVLQVQDDITVDPIRHQRSAITTANNLND